MCIVILLLIMNERRTWRNIPGFQLEVSSVLATVCSAGRCCAHYRRREVIMDQLCTL